MFPIITKNVTSEIRGPHTYDGISLPGTRLELGLPVLFSLSFLPLGIRANVSVLCKSIHKNMMYPKLGFQVFLFPSMRKENR
jgi:hypothetical protein